MGVTIEDVARRAGVSVSTVSRVLNNKGRISDETRQRVFEAAKELEHPLAFTQSAARRRTQTIGILFNRRLRSLVSDPFYGLVMVGVEERLREEGYQVLFSTFADRDSDLKMLSDFAETRRVDGLILAGCDIDMEYVNTVAAMGIPLVLVDNNVVSPKVPCAMTDNTSGAKEAMDYLLNLGHVDIAFVCGPMSHSSLYERYEGYRQSLEMRNLSVRPEWVISYQDVAAFDVDGGYEAAKRLLSHSQRPTAIFAANDAMAIGVMKAVLEEGLSIPGDISVVGFDDIEMASHTTPALTTVRVHKHDLGYHAAQMLLDLIMGEPGMAPYKVSVCTELVVRESTGQCRES